MKQLRCINLDWLEVYCLEPLNPVPDDNWFRSQGWQVDTRPYGTRSYKQMFTLFGIDGEPFLEVRRDPVGMFRNGQASFLDMNGCHLRLCNRTCYLDNAADLMQEFISRYHYTFKRIAKVDIALDFERFDYGDMPQRFLNRYVQGRYSKINQSNISAHGQDEWSGRHWWSVSWGAEKSPVLTRFYCKSKELAEVKDKPYIRQAWAVTGLVDDVVSLQKKDANGDWYKPEIWRVEFSVRSAVKNWVTIDDQVTPGLKKRSFRNTLEVYNSREKILQMFASLQLHYFHFRKYHEGRSKYDCEVKRLFNFDGQQEFYKVEKTATSRPQSDIILRLIEDLQRFLSFHYDPATNKAASLLIEDLRRLQAERMAVRPWDDTEKKLLRALIARRLNNPNEPYSVSQRLATTMADIEAAIWSEETCEDSR